jgi:hypothetical protein
MSYVYSPKDLRSKFNYLIQAVKSSAAKRKISSYLDSLATETVAGQALESLERRWNKRRKSLTRLELEGLIQSLTVKVGSKTQKGSDILTVILGLKTSRLPQGKNLLDFFIEHGALELPARLKVLFTFRQAFAEFNVPSISRFNKAWESIMRIIFEYHLKKRKKDFKKRKLSSVDYGVGQQVHGIRIGKVDDCIVFRGVEILVEYKGTIEGNQGRIIKDRVISEALALLGHAKNRHRYYLAVVTGSGLNRGLINEIKTAMRRKRFFLAGATSDDTRRLGIQSIEQALGKIKGVLSKR